MSEIPPRLLRETLRGSTAPAQSGCLDADTLAAWSDGTLRRRERASVESHAASCARCQALLAAMARTAPPTAPARSWRVSIAWLAPLAAAAVALLVWINVPTAPLKKATFEKAAQDARPAPATVTSQVAQAERAPSPAAEPPTASADRRPALKAAVQPNVAKAPPAAVAPAPLAKAEREKRAAATGATESSIRTEPPTAAPKDAAARADAAAPTQSNLAAAAPPPAPMALARAAEDQATSRLRAQAAAAKLSTTATEILSPTANVRWRILAGGSVARSADSGATWQTQSTGVSTTLTAGSAPDANTCWLVGRGGTVVVSSDGRSWQRVPFPEAIDLTSIRASGRTAATVTAADGRTFTTTDGGTTWR